jgi:hypothetical protein
MVIRTFSPPEIISDSRYEIHNRRPNNSPHAVGGEDRGWIQIKIKNAMLFQKAAESY